MKLIAYFFLFWTGALSCTCRAEPLCIVSTLYGKIKGTCGDVTQYLSVPYAKPPNGSLRFKDPEAPDLSNETIIAQSYPPYCPQVGRTEISEDCLYANVFTPATYSSGEHLGSLPVMVFVHGGSFIEYGSADETYHGSDLAKAGNVLVVTFNYRLGLLGFLGTGNFAVKDTLMLLDWIQQNIARFGGDPDNVTIFGQSSGATMIRALLQSPNSVGLFTRAILQSDPQLYGFNNATYANKLSDYFQTLAGATTVSQLQQLSVSTILEIQQDIYEEAVNGSLQEITLTPFQPTVDETLICSQFGKSMANPVDIMIGTVLNETVTVINQTLTIAEPLDAYGSILEYYFGQALATDMASNNIFTSIISSSGDDVVREQLAFDTLSYIFTCPYQSNVDKILHLNEKAVWMYRFDEGIVNVDNEDYSMCFDDNTVCHEDDLYLVFGTFSAATDTQRALSAEVQARWVAFATDGNPNYQGGAQWSSSNAYWKQVFVMSGSGSHELSSVNGDACEFFTKG